MNRLSIFALAALAFVLAPVLAVLADTSNTLVVVGPDGATAVVGSPEAISAATITLIAALAGWFLAVFPTAHDNGSIMGRLVNILKLIGKGIGYVLQVLVGFRKDKESGTTIATTPPATPVTSEQLDASKPTDPRA